MLRPRSNWEMIDLTGQQFGRYRLVRQLGSGGFASVYLGQHVFLDAQQAAMKILHLTNVDVQKFREEANTTASLVHPHIVRLLDFDIEQGMPYLVLDYAPQGSLRDRHPEGSQLPLATIVSYVKAMATALQYAHDRHLLHRDVKPANMLIGRHGELLLSDFGIAVLSKTGRTSLQAAYGMGGTAAYMAPEMFSGKPEKASDQYALAITVYEWLCGTPPFTEGNPIQLGYQHTHVAVPSLRKKLPELAERVEAVVLRALAKAPKDRFPSVMQFAQALEEASKVASSDRNVTAGDDPALSRNADQVKIMSRVVTEMTSLPGITFNQMDTWSKDFLASITRHYASLEEGAKGQVAAALRDFINHLDTQVSSADGDRLLLELYGKVMALPDQRLKDCFASVDKAKLFVKHRSL
jgi:serine/threonine protein kinase